jgi:hypothetical protein
VAGLLQAILVALWIEWRKNHPDQFTVEAQTNPTTTELAPTVKLNQQKPYDSAQRPNP